MVLERQSRLGGQLALEIVQDEVGQLSAGHDALLCSNTDVAENLDRAVRILQMIEQLAVVVQSVAPGG